MRVFIVCNSHILAGPTIKMLFEQEHLAGVAVPTQSYNLIKPILKQIGVADDHIHKLEKGSWKSTLKELLTSDPVDVVWALTFPWKVPADLLKIPEKGFINFHFGILPKYKGADPVFWEIKNQEKEGGLTVHLMNEEIDEGPALIQEKIPIVPGMTYGIQCERLGHMAVESAKKLLELLDGESLEYLELEQVASEFEHKPTDNDLTIDWKNQTSAEIEFLINACNPKYGGARTKLGNTELSILEVTPITLEQKVEAEPGQIVFSDAIYGVIVKCCDGECVRLTIAQMAEGYFSGVRLFNLGFVPGHTFE